MPVLASVIGLGPLRSAREPAWAIALAAVLGGCLLAHSLAPSVRAEPLTLDGLTFSDEFGGVEIVEGWGKGTLDDPFVLVEEITEHEPAILVVRGMSHRFGNRIRSHHDVGFALTKIVRNRTGRAWSQFDVELREFIDQPSPFGDGLAFGQASEAGRPFVADRFSEYVETYEPFDAVAFFGGSVEPGETVVLSVVITDTTPRHQFYLLQKRDTPLALMPAAPAAVVSALLAVPRMAQPQGRSLQPGD
jgi:hypothetical protein